MKLKPKRDLFTIAMMAGFLFSGISWAEDVWQDVEKNHAYTFCAPMSFPDKSHGYVHTKHFYNVFNNTPDKEWHVTVTYKVCPSNMACTVKHIENRMIPPHGQFVSGYSEYRTPVDYWNVGTYWFTTVTEMTGDVNSTQTQTCSYTIIKKSNPWWD